MFGCFKNKKIQPQTSSKSPKRGILKSPSVKHVYPESPPYAPYDVNFITKTYDKCVSKKVYTSEELNPQSANLFFQSDIDLIT
jgi:hypothetical protein